jgi:flagellar basal-body rod modification protein FlgD
MSLNVTGIPAATEAVTTGLFGTTGTSSSTGTSAAGDKEMFLQLLVAQMRYQDPMNPTDSSQFLSQSAQFTALEKMQDVADKTAQLLSAQMAFGAAGLVGKQVTWTDSDGATQSGAVSGVTFGVDGPMLSSGDATFPVTSLLSVKDGSGTTDSTTTTSS